MTRCTCGHEAVLKLYIHFRYPRAGFGPMAADPYYVHGGAGYIETCGNPQCEADAFLASREQIIGNHAPFPPLSAEQVSGLELQVYLCPGEGMRILGGATGSAT